MAVLLPKQAQDSESQERGAGRGDGGLQGLQTIVKSPGALKHWNQGENSYLFLDGEAEAQSGKGVHPGSPVGQGQRGGPARASGLQAGVPRPGRQVRGREVVTSVKVSPS